MWCIDFKGWFLTGDGKRCEPLTLSDAHSRYLLRCQAMAHTDTDQVWPARYRRRVWDDPGSAVHRFALHRIRET